MESNSFVIQQPNPLIPPLDLDIEQFLNRFQTGSQDLSWILDEFPDTSKMIIEPTQSQTQIQPQDPSTLFDIPQQDPSSLFDIPLEEYINTINYEQQQEPYTCHKMIIELKEYIETIKISYDKIHLDNDLQNLLDYLEQKKINDKSKDFKIKLLNNLKKFILRNYKIPTRRNLSTIIYNLNNEITFQDIKHYVKKKSQSKRLDKQEVKYVIDYMKKACHNNSLSLAFSNALISCKKKMGGPKHDQIDFLQSMEEITTCEQIIQKLRQFIIQNYRSSYTDTDLDKDLLRLKNYITTKLLSNKFKKILLNKILKKIDTDKQHKIPSNECVREILRNIESLLTPITQEEIPEYVRKKIQKGHMTEEDIQKIIQYVLNKFKRSDITKKNKYYLQFDIKNAIKECSEVQISKLPEFITHLLSKDHRLNEQEKNIIFQLFFKTPIKKNKLGKPYSKRVINTTINNLKKSILDKKKISDIQPSFPYQDSMIQL
jgi:hypothetical protein